MSCLAVVIVLDGVGIGALPDAASFGDEGASTLPHVAERTPGFSLPFFASMGLGHLASIAGVPALDRNAVSGAYGRMMTASAAKDTITGHWELMGCPLDRPFATFPRGFPPSLISRIEQTLGRPVLGNVAASGTEIIQRLGIEHLRTGNPIVYTSADSVLQVAAHEQVMTSATLHSTCESIRRLLDDGPLIGRVIARPFAGEPGSFYRTAGRRDFALPPPRPTLLDAASDAGLPVTGIGKIHDIFVGRGITRTEPTSSNADGLNRLLTVVTEQADGIILANLLDFDMLYGHRNDPGGYARAMIEADRRLPSIIAACPPGTVLMLCADHGCDPTHPGTDHTREYVPLLVTVPGARPPGIPLGTRSTLADVSATVAEFLNLPFTAPGQSFFPLLVPLLRRE